MATEDFDVCCGCGVWTETEIVAKPGYACACGAKCGCPDAAAHAAKVGLVGSGSAAVAAAAANGTNATTPSIGGPDDDDDDGATHSDGDTDTTAGVECDVCGAAATTTIPSALHVGCVIPACGECVETYGDVWDVDAHGDVDPEATLPPPESDAELEAEIAAIAAEDKEEDDAADAAAASEVGESAVVTPDSAAIEAEEAEGAAAAAAPPPGFAGDADDWDIVAAAAAANPASRSRRPPTPYSPSYSVIAADGDDDAEMTEDSNGAGNDGESCWRSDRW